MSKNAFVIGASGQAGEAVIRALLKDGWAVRAGSRSEHLSPDSVEGVLVDRESDDSFSAAIGAGVDVLVDCVAYTEDHAKQIVGASDRIGSAVVLSTVSVYADAEGHTFDESTGVEDFPIYPNPIFENQGRTRPGPATYSTRKVAMEDAFLSAEVPLPVSAWGRCGHHTPTGKLVANVMMSVAEREREGIGECRSAAMQAAKRAGKHMGRMSVLPQATGSACWPCAGLTRWQPAAQLNAEGLTTATGTMWTVGTVTNAQNRLTTGNLSP